MIEIGSNNVYYASESSYSSHRVYNSDKTVFLSYNGYLSSTPTEYLSKYERRRGKATTNINLKLLNESGETYYNTRNILVNEFPVFLYSNVRGSILYSAIVTLEGISKIEEEEKENWLVIKGQAEKCSSFSILSGFRKFNSELSAKNHYGVLPPVGSEMSLKDKETRTHNWRKVIGHGINPETKLVYIEYLGDNDVKKKFHINLEKTVGILFKQPDEEIDPRYFNISCEEH